MLRTGAVRRLRQAQRLLPPPLRLSVLDAWRPRRFQQQLVAHYGDEATLNGFVAPIADRSYIPPHVTGGAVDLTMDAGLGPLALGSDFDEFTDRALLLSTECDDPPISGRLRRILFWAMVDAGFAPYEMEWWHYSYGDQNWAAYYGRQASLYAEARQAGGVPTDESPAR